MQRLFSTFADGLPGGGILLLRLLAGSALINRGIAAWSAEAHANLFFLQILTAVAGLLIVGGLWTPVVGVLTGVAELWLAFTQPETQWLPILLAGIVIAVAMIGPGAWSIDARLYGRKQIIPPDSH